MNKPKVSRNCSSAARNQPVASESKGDNPRSPLKDLNVSASSTSVSAEAPSGCFRFLASNSSSKITLPRTPKSTPIPSKPRPGAANKNTKYFNFDNPRKPRSNNLEKRAPRAPLQRKNDHKLTSVGNFRRQILSENKAGCTSGNGMQFAEKSDRSAPKLPSRFRVVNPSLSEWEKGDDSIFQGKFKRATLAQTDAGKVPSFSFLPVLEDNETPADKVPSTSGFTETSLGSELIDTPVNKMPSSGSYFVSTLETTTPPLQASVSPEIPDGVVGGLPSTPACFAAGHVLVGVSDKRKCRPRGILTVQNQVQESGSCKEREIQDVLGFTNGVIFDRTSLNPSPAKASINWISSYKVQKDCSFKYKSPELSGLGSTTVLVEDCFTPPSSDGFSKIAVGKRSLEFEGLEKPTTLVSEVTPPSSGNNLCRAAVYEGSAGNGPQRLDFEESIGHKALVLEAKNIEASLENGLLQFRGFEGRNTPDPKSTKTSPSISLIPYGCSVENIRCQSLCCPTKTSVNWVLSPSVDEQTGIRGNGSPQDKGLMGPAIFIREASQCDLDLHRTSTTTSAITAANKSCLSEVRGYRYNRVEDSPYSAESWGSQNVICTPGSGSHSEKHIAFSWMSMEDYLDHDIELRSMVEALKTVSSSTQSLHVTCDTSKALLVPDLSFQLSYPATPSNSTDGTHLQRTNFDKASAVRISCREGLVSRIFEMDELDCWQSEDDDYDLLKADFHLGISPDLRSSSLTENDLQLTNGFGSPEYVDDQRRDGKCKLRVPLELPGCAESISTNGGGLVSSGDSDWTMCYKNQLFEM
ncbi:uncharacterized protein [Aristolochia californica]|uniref:uncharacterized protein n=1 Tax=Aristolochia californica TaxID=171875 RepID=UPI0035D82484